ncbi:MAG: hypothetical protein IPI58_09820 [Alphaproteobacteria bacterium]|nr:MAG: hypothetical protein IPI58_09820 [Alphaproteobacteria bacterium]
MNKLRKPGRPQMMEGGKSIEVYLSEADRALAREIGGGVISVGIRLALAAARRLRAKSR